MSIEKQPNKDPNKREPVEIVIGDGEIVNFDNLLVHESQTQSAMSSSALRTGDLLALQYEKPDGILTDLVFEVTRARWGRLGVSLSFTPQKNVVGTISGNDVPEELAGEEFRFLGSGWGGTMRQVGTIATGRSLNFYNKNWKYSTPPISNYEVLRVEADEFLPIAPTEIDAQDRGEIIKHQERMDQAQKMLELFGFDAYDFSDGTKSSRNYGPGAPRGIMSYEDSRYTATYKAGMATGNELNIYDKKTDTWVNLTYYNFSNEDILQVGSVDSMQGIVYDRNTPSASDAHRAGKAITTYVTSRRYDMDLISYLPSIAELVKDVKAPIDATGKPVRPEFQISPDGEVVVYGDHYIDALEEKQPGTYERIKNSLCVVPGSNGRELVLGKKNITLQDPDKAIATISKNVETNQARDDKVSNTPKSIRKRLGRFARRQK